MSRDVPVQFATVMDYVCIPSNGKKSEININRIKATIQNEIALRELAPDIPWLPILQGDNFEERSEDLELRRALNLLPIEYAGIGSLVGRGIQAAIDTVQSYATESPRVKFHGFGKPIRPLPDPVVSAATNSWG